MIARRHKRDTSLSPAVVVTHSGSSVCGRKGGIDTPFRTSELAVQGGVNPQILRYYEREGLLPEPPRLHSGYRLYPDSAVSRIRFIKRSQELGFTLAEIRDLLALRIDKNRDREEVRKIAKARLREIDARIDFLQTMRNALQHLSRSCHGHGPADECPILAGIDSSGTFRFRLTLYPVQGLPSDCSSSTEP